VLCFFVEGFEWFFYWLVVGFGGTDVEKEVLKIVCKSNFLFIFVFFVFV
jgi:hypothetical protein